MSLKILSSKVLNKITGGAGEHEVSVIRPLGLELYRFLEQGGFFEEDVSQALFLEVYQSTDISYALMMPLDSSGQLTVIQENAVSRFGRSLGIYLKAKLVKGVTEFLQLKADTLSQKRLNQ